VEVGWWVGSWSHHLCLPLPAFSPHLLHATLRLLHYTCLHASATTPSYNNAYLATTLTPAHAALPLLYVPNCTRFTTSHLAFYTLDATFTLKNYRHLPHTPPAPHHSHHPALPPPPPAHPCPHPLTAFLLLSTLWWMGGGFDGWVGGWVGG